MKIKYENAEMEITCLEADDIIVTSVYDDGGEVDNGGDNDGNWN